MKGAAPDLVEADRHRALVERGLVTHAPAKIDDLKARQLYDDSVIVLTSDHGDSLGEEGRWGHAYTLFPEVLQVPLIVHLPPRLRAQFDLDEEEGTLSAALEAQLGELAALGLVHIIR